jgi:hypothetical protein
MSTYKVQTLFFNPLDPWTLTRPQQHHSRPSVFLSISFFSKKQKQKWEMVFFSIVINYFFLNDSSSFYFFSCVFFSFFKFLKGRKINKLHWVEFLLFKYGYGIFLSVLLCPMTNRLLFKGNLTHTLTYTLTHNFALSLVYVSQFLWGGCVFNSHRAIIKLNGVTISICLFFWTRILIESILWSICLTSVKADLVRLNKKRTNKIFKILSGFNVVRESVEN